MTRREEVKARYPSGSVSSNRVQFIGKGPSSKINSVLKKQGNNRQAELHGVALAVVVLRERLMLS